MSADRPERNRRRAARMRTGTGGKLLITLVIVAVVLLSFALFFRVRTVEVQGNSIYSADAVAEASGVKQGDNLLTINKASVAGRITASLPYVQQVRIARVLPDVLVLEVHESDAAFAVRASDGREWLMSFTGKLLEPSDGAEHPKILGVTLSDPEAGHQAKSEDEDNLKAALSILSALEGTGLADKITQIDVTRTFDLTMLYGDQYEIKLGGTDRIDYKIQYLLAVLDQLSPYQTGTIDLTFEEEKVARFIPW